MKYTVPTTVNYQPSGVLAGGASEIYRKELINKYDIKNLFSAILPISVEATIDELVDIICKTVGKPMIGTLPVGVYDLIIEFESFVVSLDDYDPFVKKEKRVTFILTGSLPEVERVYKALEEQYRIEADSYVDWFYMAKGQISSSTMNLQHHGDIHDEFYPWIKPSVETFQQNFLDSSANILLLLGIPGTGKSTLVRDFIHRHKLRAAVALDEELVSSDELFIEFMKGRYDLLVVEDADVMLRDRKGGNRMMSKLLNASDGLIQTRKKIIFTANLTEIDEVDSALIRPGRCFETLMFRELSFGEATAASRVAGLAEPSGKVTLAELFSKGPTTHSSQRVGFAMP